MTRSPLLPFALAFLLASVSPSIAQQHMNMPGMNMHETRSTAPYHPGLGDLMTAFVQPRHIKLGLAGTAQNWAYAAHELHELQETFDNIAKLVPKHGNLSLPDTITATVTQPMASIDSGNSGERRTCIHRGLRQPYFRLQRLPPERRSRGDCYPGAGRLTFFRSGFSSNAAEMRIVGAPLTNAASQ